MFSETITPLVAPATSLKGEAHELASALLLAGSLQVQAVETALPVPFSPIPPAPTSKPDFEQAREAFDSSIKQFLSTTETARYSEKRTPPYDGLPLADYVETVALADFFQNTPSPLSVLLRQTGLQQHLTRPVAEVEFTGDAYQPALSTFEERVYNLAAHNKAGSIPFRYNSDRRQNLFGDTIKPEINRDDIGDYFGTRRADNSVTRIMAQRLEAEAAKHSSSLPVHVTNSAGPTIVECLNDALNHARSAQAGLHCYLMQGRHCIDNSRGRHFGALVAILDAGEKPLLRRAMFFDSTRMDSGDVHWRNDFELAVDKVFPSAPGENKTSTRLQDGGIAIQRRHDGMPERHKDIDCSFYTFAMARAVIQIACEQPELLLHGPVPEVRSAMTARMPEYYALPDCQKSPLEVRETNVALRWEIGRDYLKSLMPLPEPVAMLFSVIVPRPSQAATDILEIQ